MAFHLQRATKAIQEKEKIEEAIKMNLTRSWKK
jgi:hypothetical protein